MKNVVLPFWLFLALILAVLYLIFANEIKRNEIGSLNKINRQLIEAMHVHQLTFHVSKPAKIVSPTHWIKEKDLTMAGLE